jgi:enamine deaminase RidA (YjgF/YER057c/UK114 family)
VHSDAHKFDVGNGFHCGHAVLVPGARLRVREVGEATRLLCPSWCSSRSGVCFRLELSWCRSSLLGEQDDHMRDERLTVSSGSPLEPRIGFSRATRIGRYVAVAGTAPIGDDGVTVGPGDVYAQMVRCLDIAERALRDVGASVEDVIRTRIMLTDIAQYEEAARAHGERFSAVRPACTFVEASRFIDPDWLVEVEVDAVLGADSSSGQSSAAT